MHQDAVRSRIEEFTREIEVLVRRATLDAIGSAFGEQGRRAAATPLAVAKAAPLAVTKAAAPVAPVSTKVSIKRSGSGKRTPAQLAAIDSAILAFVKATPAQGVEQMGKALGVPTNDLKLRVLGLVTAKKIAKKGKKRATKYFAV